jgi:transforming growth factor-beta-induced protein
MNDLNDFCLDQSSDTALIAVHCPSVSRLGHRLMRQFVISAVLAAFLCHPVFAEDSAKDKDIVDTAVSAGSFKTLVAAVQAAELVDALKGEGPLTVFAPTDEAFAKLPKGTVEALLKDKAKLQKILKYHVVAGRVMAADVVKLKAAKTLLGSSVRVDSGANGVAINSAKVVKADITCSNGVIHVIDTVLLPPADNDAKDLVETAVAAGSFKTLVAALQAAELVDALKGEGPLTVFAPTDEAFAKLPRGTVEALLKDKAKLQKILKYHVVSGRITSAQVVKVPSAKTLAGQSVHITSCQGVKINNANVVKADIAASNGIIHVIDTVLLPQ